MFTSGFDEYIIKEKMFRISDGIIYIYIQWELHFYQHTYYLCLCDIQNRVFVMDIYNYVVSEQISRKDVSTDIFLNFTHSYKQDEIINCK